jgi:hypothetical protein
MAMRQPTSAAQPGPSAARIFSANDVMNQVLIEHLDRAAWNAEPPGGARSIAAIFTQMHNVRTKWIRSAAPHIGVPRQLHRARCIPGQARSVVARSAAGSIRCPGVRGCPGSKT